MNCPYCNHHETKVYDSRESKDGLNVKRRRECLNCQKRFLTVEKTIKLQLEVEKRDGKIEDFNLEKIRKSLLKCCEKRPITLEQIDICAEKVVEELKQVDEGIIQTIFIGKILLNILKDLDEIAFLKYAIVHNKYESINSFVQELNDLKSFKGIEYK